MIAFKVARPRIFVGTPSIFELISYILKQIDLYCKNIVTHVLHIDLTFYYDIIFGRLE